MYRFSKTYGWKNQKEQLNKPFFVIWTKSLIAQALGKDIQTQTQTQEHTNKHFKNVCY